MPNPKAIDVPNLGFSEEQITVLHIMMNKLVDMDYLVRTKLLPNGV